MSQQLLSKVVDLDVEFVHQFEDHNFRFLGRFIFLAKSL